MSSDRSLKDYALVIAIMRAVSATALLLVSFRAFASPEAEAWLDRMATAIESLNYHGTLVYMQPGKAETFTLYHRVAGDMMTERVVSMDGDGAEIIRTRDEIICIFPGQQKVVVDKRTAKSAKPNPLLDSLPDYDSSMSSNYSLSLESDYRVAGRSAVVVSITPQDVYRYEHRLWLDESTAMPLKTQLLAEDESMPLEEIFFTSVALLELVPEEMVQPTLNTDEYTWVRHGSKPDLVPGPEGSVDWMATDLPPGFMLTQAKLEYMAGSEDPRVHLVYTDGLASVSVFVDEGVAASEQVEGFTSMGASNAYSLMVEGLLVTAMGEVPPETVRRIAVSTRMQKTGG